MYKCPYIAWSQYIVQQKNKGPDKSNSMYDLHLENKIGSLSTIIINISEIL